MCNIPGTLDRSTATPIVRGGFCLGGGGGGVGWLRGRRSALRLPCRSIWGILLQVSLCFLFKKKKGLVALLVGWLSLWVGLRCEVGPRSPWHPDLLQGFSALSALEVLSGLVYQRLQRLKGQLAQFFPRCLLKRLCKCL